MATTNSAGKVTTTNIKAAEDKAAKDKAAAEAKAKAIADAAPKPNTTKNPDLLLAKRKASMVAIGNADDLASAPLMVTPVPEDIKFSIRWSGNSHPMGTPSDGGGASGSSVPSAAIKVATPDIITINQETLPAELMTSLIFENIGGQELLSISRHDLISGSNMDYQAIKNLRDVYLNNNPLNIIPMPDLSNNYAKNFPIVWESHIIEEFSSLDSTHIYLDNAKKELNLLVTNMKPGEQVEVEILSSVTGYNATKF